MLPASLMPARRPVLALLGMDETRFAALHLGDDDETEADDPDLAVLDAIADLVAERAEALIPEWHHRQATIDVVECFAGLAADVAELDASILAVSRWLCGIGGRVDLRGAGTAYQAAELRVGLALDACDGADGMPDEGVTASCQAAIDEAAALATASTLHVVFGDVYAVVALLSDRIRVVVDLPTICDLDMGGHHWDGDEDADDDPVTPPLVAA